MHYCYHGDKPKPNIDKPNILAVETETVEFTLSFTLVVKLSGLIPLNSSFQ